MLIFRLDSAIHFLNDRDEDDKDTHLGFVSLTWLQLKQTSPERCLLNLHGNQASVLMPVALLRLVCFCLGT